MLYYMLIIMLCMIFQFFGLTKTEKGRRTFVVIIFGLLTLLACLRAYTVGVDTLQYYRNYTNIGQNIFLNYTSRYERGFYTLCKLLYYLNSNPQTLIFVTSIIIIPIVGIFIYKNSDDTFLSTFLYITLGLFFFNMTGMRQSLALAFCLIAYEFFKNRKIKIYILLILFASLFHTSALVFLAFPFFDKIKYRKTSYIMTIIISVFSFVFGKSIIFFIMSKIRRYAGYSGSEFGVSNYFGALFQFSLYLFIYTICHYVFTRTERKDNDRNTFYLKCLSLCVICNALTMQINIVGRFIPYLSIFTVVLVTNLKNRIYKSKPRLLYTLLFIFVSLSYFFIIEIFRPEWNGVEPFRFFWELF